MHQQPKLSDSIVKALPAPEAGNKVHYDAELKGFGVRVTAATEEAGRLRLRIDGGQDAVVDHVLLGTGYKVDLAKYAFLAAPLVDAIECVNGYPKLADHFETSVSGLHIVGAPAAWSFGPLMRFVAGSDFAARTLAAGMRR